VQVVPQLCGDPLAAMFRQHCRLMDKDELRRNTFVHAEPAEHRSFADAIADDMLACAAWRVPPNAYQERAFFNGIAQLRVRKTLRYLLRNGFELGRCLDDHAFAAIISLRRAARAVRFDRRGDKHGCFVGDDEFAPCAHLCEQRSEPNLLSRGARSAPRSSSDPVRPCRDNSMSPFFLNGSGASEAALPE